MRKDYEVKRGQHWTSGEFARVLGMTSSAFRSRLRAGAIPEHVKLNEDGWKLWDSEQVRETLERQSKYGILRKI